MQNWKSLSPDGMAKLLQCQWVSMTEIAPRNLNDLCIELSDRKAKLHGE